MDWIQHFQLFLFDFDGLLVNTEHLQHQAYVNMLEKRGHHLDWSLPQYCSVAHLNATALREALYVKFPDLDPNWQMLYEEKKQMYQELLGSGKVELMPGVLRLLEKLAKVGIQRCVATHSRFEQIQAIRAQLPILQTIPHWITREDYGEPKPHPECYLRAIQLWGKPGDRIVGFEDSIRGLHALQKTPALPILVCPSHNPVLEVVAEGAIHFETFEAIPADWNMAKVSKRTC
jgi:HAD superfamily hydrolase (TIGR01509 family)